MTSEQPRRAATVPLPVPQNHDNPPPAPPLPPQQRARNALNRFLGFPARAFDGDEDGSQETRYWAEANRATVGRLPSLSAHNASASHRTGLEINSLSINDEGTHALLAGREIFKTVRVDEGSCSEDINLRAKIKSFDAHVTTGGLTKDAVNIHDVAWGKGAYGHYIAAATYNGPIVVYDLGYPGIEVARLNEHRRQVHRVTFNPHAGQHFLSGSQDGTVRLWDLRDLRRDSATFASTFKTTGQNEGVRDVKWSPTDIFALALCTDGGFVQRWDTRKLKTPLAKIAAHTRIAAHTSPCATIDWHPDGKHVLSASADKTVKVWNLAAESSRRNKPAYEIKTPHPLRNARWRPSCQSSLPKDRGARQCSQIVASYERDYDVLHIWDFRRPWLPFREIQGYRSAPTDLLWHSQDLLWTVGKEGMFLQHDVKYADKVLDNRNMQTFGVSSLGEINIASQRRFSKGRLGLDSRDSEQFLDHHHHHSLDEKGRSGHSAGRGGADDSVDDTFLSTSFGKKNGRHGSNARSSRAQLDSTPTLAPADLQQPHNPRTMSLEDVLTKKKIFKPGQGTAAGALPGAPNGLLLTFFAQKYKTRPLTEPPTAGSFLKVQELFETNASLAQQASMYRMAQSWRLAGQVTMTELRRRAIAHREQRVRGTAPRRSALDESPFAKRARKYLASDRRHSSKPSTPLARPVKTLEGLQGVNDESTSNVPTPVARPVSDHPGSALKARQTPLKDISQDDEGLILPPSLLSPSQMQQQNLIRGRQVSTQSAVTDQSWYDSAEARDQRRADLSSWKVQPKEQFSLEHGLDVRPRTERHNSDESFGMFPSLSSREASNPVSSVASMTSLMHTVHENLMDASPHGSMDLGSSSSESYSGPSTHAQSFFSYPSAAMPRQQPPSEVLSSESGSHDDDHVVKPSVPLSQGQPTDIPPVRDIARDVQTLALNNQQSFSSDSEVLSSSAETAGTVETKPSIDTRSQNIPEEEWTENMEASGTIVPATHSQTYTRLLRGRGSSNSLVKPTSLMHNTESAPSALPRKPSLRPEDVPFVVSDFIGTDYSVDTEVNAPFTLVSMLNQLLAYHTTSVPDAQAATHFLLLLTPLLPQTHPLPRAEIDKTITVYSEHFATLGYTDEEIYSLFQNSFEALIKSGIQPMQAESIITTYHDQLVRTGLFNNAAYLRRLSFPTYPAVYEQGLKDTEISFMCGACKKPINNPSNKFRCETCEERQQPCPICYSATSPYELPHKRSSKSKKDDPKRESGGVKAMSNNNNNHEGQDSEEEKEDETQQRWAQAIRNPLLYSTCLLCNHTAHTACLRAWHAPSSPSTSISSTPISEGTCPTPACLCACTPGPARSQQLKLLEEEEMERRGSKTSSMRNIAAAGAAAAAASSAGGGGGGGSGGQRVKEDDWVAGESRAAITAASGLAQATAAAAAAGGSGGSGSGAGAPAAGGGAGGLGQGVRKRATTPITPSGKNPDWEWGASNERGGAGGGPEIETARSGVTTPGTGTGMAQQQRRKRSSNAGLRERKKSVGFQQGMHGA